MQWFTYQTGDNDEYTDVKPCQHPKFFNWQHAIDYADGERMRKDQRYSKTFEPNCSIVDLISGDIERAIYVAENDQASNAIY